jgi:RNA polymerase sigma-70 factor (ECF subfamily)
MWGQGGPKVVPRPRMPNHFNLLLGLDWSPTERMGFRPSQARAETVAHGHRKTGYPMMVTPGFALANTGAVRCALAPLDPTTRGLDEAMDRYAQGDDRAFATLHAGLRAMLHRFLGRLTGAPALAEDLLQETFIRMHRARGSFARGAAVTPWAYTIARNAWLDHVRAARVREGARAHVARGISEGESTGPDDDSEQILIARQTAEIVQQILAKLPASQREAFVLLRYEGMSVEEAAEIVGSTPTAVKLRAFRAYEALRDALGRAKLVEGRAHGS